MMEARKAIAAEEAGRERKLRAAAEVLREKAEGNELLRAVADWLEEEADVDDTYSMCPSALRVAEMLV